MKTRKYLTGFDVDTDAFADALRRLAEGIDDGDVVLHDASTDHRIDVEEPSRFGLSFDYSATHAYEDVVDVIRYATDAYLRFVDVLIGDILSGKKKATVRYQLERDIEVGEVIAAIDEDGDVFAELTVEGVFEMTPAQVIEYGVAQYEGHSVEFLVERLRELYDDDTIDRDTPVTVVLWGDVEPNAEYPTEQYE